MTIAGLFYSLLTAFCWGTVPVIYRRNMVQMPFEKMNALRSFGFLGAMGVLVYFYAPHSFLEVPLSIIALIGGACFLGNVLGDVLYMKSIGLLGIGKASAITSISPLVVMIISMFWLGESLTPWGITGALSIIFGLNLVRRTEGVQKRSREEANLRKGFLLAVLTALCWGCSFPVTKWILSNTTVDVASLNFWRAVAFVPFSWAFWLFRASRMPRKETSLFTTSKVVFLELLAAGALALALGGFFLARALERAPASLVSPLTSSYPLIAVSWGVFLFHEKLKGMQLLGVCAIIVGTVIISL
ncbi:MAG TPA: DMT family transporter [Synergistaceae bacterium]|nr:DMT family transporter [Synergistaceae bacterium]HPQ36268.1 DMT family transporter [Synergistaceae bacterium]